MVSIFLRTSLISFSYLSILSWHYSNYRFLSFNFYSSCWLRDLSWLFFLIISSYRFLDYLVPMFMSYLYRSIDSNCSFSSSFPFLIRSYSFFNFSYSLSFFIFYCFYIFYIFYTLSVFSCSISSLSSFFYSRSWSICFYFSSTKWWSNWALIRISSNYFSLSTNSFDF